MGVSKNRGTPKSSILIGFSIINHPFWGTSIFGNTHMGLPSVKLTAKAPENGCLEYFLVSFWVDLFSAKMYEHVSFREGIPLLFGGLEVEI